MYKRGYFIKGLLVVSVIGLLCVDAFAAQRSEPNDPNKAPAGGQATSQQGAGTAGQTAPSSAGTAGQMSRSGAGTAGQMAQPAMALTKSSDLIGKKLVNSKNEDLGTIHDLVLTPDHQQVSYAALAHGGVFGIGSKLFAIPWTAIKVGANDRPTTDISKATLDQATGFDDKSWPAQGDSRLVSAGAAGAGMSPSTTTPRSSTSQSTAGMSQEPNKPTAPGGTRGMTSAQGDESNQMAAAGSNADVQNRRVSRLTGLSVRNPKNDDIGDVEDFVINVPNGHVEYTVVSFGGFWGIGEKYAAIPSTAIDLQPAQGIARINADRQALESVAFDPGSWPDLTNREYSQRLRDVFKEGPERTTLGYVPPAGQAQQPAVSSEQAWSAQSEYVKHFDASNVTTINGMVQSIGMFEPAKGVAEGLRLRVKTSDNKTITVHAGPVWYARQQKFDLKPGDQISITGSNTKIGWRSVFVASEIKKGSETLRLLSKTGQPLWGTQAQQAGRQPGQPSTATPGMSGQSGQTGQTGQSAQTGQGRNRTRP